jgi:hypothetical protein
MGTAVIHRRRCVVVAAGRSVRRNRMSHVEAQHRGWCRIDPRPWTKLAAQWWHAAGWRLVHCGHPTALWPWRLYAPDGAVHCTGALQGRPELGVAWGSLREAMDYVDEVLGRDGRACRVPRPVRRSPRPSPAQLALDFGA